MIANLTPAQRRALYGVVTAVLALLAAYGVITDQEPWLVLAAAILGITGAGTARAHVPRGRHAKGGDE